MAYDGIMMIIRKNNRDKVVLVSHRSHVKTRSRISKNQWHQHKPQINISKQGRKGKVAGRSLQIWRACPQTGDSKITHTTPYQTTIGADKKI